MTCVAQQTGDVVLPHATAAAVVTAFDVLEVRAAMAYPPPSAARQVLPEERRERALTAAIQFSAHGGATYCDVVDIAWAFVHFLASSAGEPA